MYIAINISHPDSKGVTEHNALVKSMTKIFSNFMAFSENPNFKFQNEIMKSLFLPKYKIKIVRISALCIEGRNLNNFLFIFWEKQ